MGAVPVGQLAASVPWIGPAAPALAGLAADPLPIRPLLADPGIVLLALRFARPTPTPAALADPSFLEQPILLDAAAAQLEAGADGWADPTRGPVAAVMAVCRSIAGFARRLASITKSADPAAAHAAGLLAPLGWLAVAAVDAKAVERVRAVRTFAADPHAAQVAEWGLSHDAIVRRLVARWRLPAWLANVIAHVSHVTDDAVTLGADRNLVAVVRAAVLLAERDGHRFGLLGLSAGEDVAALAALVEHAPPAWADEWRSPPVPLAADPRTLPLLPTLLRTAARSRRKVRLSNEAEVDRLHRLLAEARARFDTAVRDAKLGGLAELAAGAGHEINNPLAIISGNAQMLRAGEEDEERRSGFDAILRQTRRITDLLRDLRQFARPPLPTSTVVSASDIVAQSVAEFAPHATAKRVNLDVSSADSAPVDADAGQLRLVIGHLVRNAIEATPEDGTVRVHTETDAGVVRVTVEDSGPGPIPTAVPHLFDPFYSGRTAGRGRGLGLSTAWRFAKQNGGDIRYVRPAGGPTRFVLTLLPATTRPLQLPERRSA